MDKIKSYITPRNLLIFNIILIILFFLFSCVVDEEEGFFDSVTEIENIISPLPEYSPVPDSNEMSAEKIDLGRQLFWDPILSGSKDVACATCHHPDKGYADALDLSIGVGGIGLGEQRIGNIIAGRNAHTVVNTAFNGITINNQVNPLDAPMFWDNRTMSLEAQALLPLLSKEEMRGVTIEENQVYDIIINRLEAIPQYKAAFQDAFGTEEITTDKIAKAIASFERTLIATNSPFDRYMRGDASAMTDQQVNGMNAFINVGCAECHGGPMFSDFQLHTLGVPDNPKLPETDAGTGTYAFRTPTLRNLSLTAPYMHNGMHTSLEEVMDFYEEISEGDADMINTHLSINNIDPLARDLDMDDDVTDAIIAFMKALNDPNFNRTIPTNVPSGLLVGGHINN
ncbi:cytochrome c peroxidase [Winogradskyella sp.]|uniref:cytochrome-c peroxidase n=1 Tax=Winogradskyella sp. TaxID=1883156 RepID=UPI0026066836|nr:cytochrome c peroxidase [Winogradskyella sp.]